MSPAHVASTQSLVQTDRNRSMKINALLGSAAAAIALGLTAPAFAQQHVKVGALRCEVSADLGLIITSTQQMSCRFTSLHGWTEHYYGTVRKFGLDIGETNRGVLAWDVFAPTEGPRRGALAGEYGGVDASATVGAGVGANALVGGSGRAFALQPLSVEAQTGLSLAAGVESFTLSAAR
jgi:hypothetical protein